LVNLIATVVAWLAYATGAKTPLREGRIPNPQQSRLRPH